MVPVMYFYSRGDPAIWRNRDVRKPRKPRDECLFFSAFLSTTLRRKTKLHTHSCGT